VAVRFAAQIKFSAAFFRRDVSINQKCQAGTSTPRLLECFEPHDVPNGYGEAQKALAKLPPEMVNIKILLRISEALKWEFLTS
jgi:hypothetical protein